jgi:hypothetical protein
MNEPYLLRVFEKQRRNKTNTKKEEENTKEERKENPT